MGEKPARGIIEKRVLIQASPALIFRALTEAREIADWFCDRAASDPRIGGELRAYWRMGSRGEAQRGRARFSRLIPDALVELHWVEDDSGKEPDGQPHTITYAIREKRGNSEVTMRDDGPAPADEGFLETLEQGWISILRDLKEHCETRQRSARRRAARESSAD